MEAFSSQAITINLMAYIPPHKRHSQDKGRPSPTPEKFIPLFKSNYLSVRSQDSKIVKRGKIVRWFPVGLSENDQFPSYIHLEPVSVESFERRYGDKPLTLVNSIATEDGVVPKVGVDFEEEKDIYHIKAELNKVYHMVTDVSCLDKNLDLRLILYTKRILTAPTDDEMKSIRDLISSAVLDSEVKAYRSPSLRLKVGHADRFFLESETGEVSTETYLKLNGILSELQEQGAESDSVSTMLKDSLRMIWDNFLSCDRFLA
ncbi:hypothetical protein GH714_021995 [Hevea brasiliensis]|uniref:DUF7903 domain-containing protein n=1 Tax=Hevea brasiliensis TaxID=3981 RepID=A0A6A6M4F4_HEVBR|nr:hypothetical protein GH714_021995 [Hevea brasiliensis]